MSKLLITLALLLSTQMASAGAIDKLHAFLETTKTLRADFSQIVVAKNGKRPQQSSGVLMISRPGKFRWQIEKPYSQLLVSDGEKVWIYDPDLRQVTVKKVGNALGGTPAALLAGESGGKGSGKSTLEKDFTLSEEPDADGQQWVKAVPKSRDGQLQSIRVGFKPGAQGAELGTLEILDSFGQRSVLTFTGFEVNAAVPASHFSFVPPKGVDVLKQ